jgi:hypothetical protein
MVGEYTERILCVNTHGTGPGRWVVECPGAVRPERPPTTRTSSSPALIYAYDQMRAFCYPLLGVPLEDLLPLVDANETQIDAAGVNLLS